MKEKTLRKMALTIVEYCLAVQQKETVVIFAQPAANQLVQACYREILLRGAYPIVQYNESALERIFYTYANDQQLSTEPILTKLLYETADCCLHILGSDEPDALQNVDSEKQRKRILAQKDAKELYNRRVDAGKLRWCLCAYPTKAEAEKIGMRHKEYEDFIIQATFCDQKDPVSCWKTVHEKQQKIIDVLNTKKHMHILSKDTDLTLSVKDRIWINSDGHHNFPSGEVFSAPVEDSANGYITFSYPMLYLGKKIEGIRLEFENGLVKSYRAKTGQDVLETILGTDSGIRRLGEVAVGTNYAIKRFTGNMLFDEKIGSTMHLALGRSYSECGGKNESLLHMDMICDMTEGKILFDGEVLYENGFFTFV